MECSILFPLLGKWHPRWQQWDQSVSGHFRQHRLRSRSLGSAVGHLAGQQVGCGAGSDSSQDCSWPSLVGAGSGERDPKRWGSKDRGVSVHFCHLLESHSPGEGTLTSVILHLAMICRADRPMNIQFQ